MFEPQFCCCCCCCCWTDDVPSFFFFFLKKVDGGFGVSGRFSRPPVRNDAFPSRSRARPRGFSHRVGGNFLKISEKDRRPAHQHSCRFVNQSLIKEIYKKKNGAFHSFESLKIASRHCKAIFVGHWRDEEARRSRKTPDHPFVAVKCNQIIPRNLVPTHRSQVPPGGLGAAVRESEKPECCPLAAQSAAGRISNFPPFFHFKWFKINWDDFE